MKDTYNREIDYLRISVTDRCNLRCLYCMPEGIQKIDKERIISDEDILDIVKEAVSLGIKKIRITGGEPLVRKGIYDLISKINQVDGLEEIVLTTNGSLLLGKVSRLKDAGVKRVNISIDSLYEKTQNMISNTMPNIDYESLIKELIQEELQPIKINTVLLKGINDSEIASLISFCESYGLELRLIELMPFESDTFDYKEFFISKDEIIKNEDLTFSHSINNVDYYKTKSGYQLGFINAISSKFCENCNRIRLTSDGYIKPCLHSDHELYIKGLEKEGRNKVLKDAITSKPKQHNLDQKYTNQSKRSMNKIGG